MNEFSSNKMKINFVKFMIFNRLQKSQSIWTNAKLRKFTSKVGGSFLKVARERGWSCVKPVGHLYQSGRFHQNKRPVIFKAVYFRKF